MGLAALRKEGNPQLNIVSSNRLAYVVLFLGAALKVARVVGTVMMDKCEEVPALPDIFYAQRVQQLALDSKLALKGDERRMRYCEVRIP